MVQSTYEGSVIRHSEFVEISFPSLGEEFVNSRQTAGVRAKSEGKGFPYWPTR